MPFSLTFLSEYFVFMFKNGIQKFRIKSDCKCNLLLICTLFELNFIISIQSSRWSKVNRESLVGCKGNCNKSACTHASPTRMHFFPHSDVQSERHLLHSYGDNDQRTNSRPNLVKHIVNLFSR